jgi:purine-nucleoside phosphorylase
MTTSRLDELTSALTPSVIGEEGLPAPHAFALLGTGIGALHSSLTDERHLQLSHLDGVPEAWRGSELIAGRIGDLQLWLLEDAPTHASWTGGAPDTEAWERAWPIWLAAACGASLGIVTAAGVGLGTRDGPPAVGSLVAVTDHLNLSGSTPLRGLGESRLGPLFPDSTLIHHEALRIRAIDRARSQGIGLEPGIAACVTGPSLMTPAELAWLQTTGASVAVQGLADPLIAAAHAGLGLLTVVAVTDSGKEPLRMHELVERAEACAPALEELIVHVATDMRELIQTSEDAE